MGSVSVDSSDGLVIISISGKLSYSELAEGQEVAAKFLEHDSAVPILVLAGDFAGWEEEGDWGDLSFQEAFDSKIGRMAVVCENGWRDKLSLFTGQGLRQFPIQFYAAPEEEAARDWLRKND